MSQNGVSKNQVLSMKSALPYRVGQGFALESKDAFLQNFGCVIGEDVTRPLQDNRAMIVLVIDPVNGAAGNLDACSNGGLVDSQSVHALTAKCRDQRGMDIEDAMVEVGGNEQMLQVASHHDERCARSTDCVEHCLRMRFGIGEIPFAYHARRDLGLRSEL